MQSKVLNNTVTRTTNPQRTTGGIRQKRRIGYCDETLVMSKRIELMVLVVGQFVVHTTASIVSDHVSSQRSHALSTGGVCTSAQPLVCSIGKFIMRGDRAARVRHGWHHCTRRHYHPQALLRSPPHVYPAGPLIQLARHPQYFVGWDDMPLQGRWRSFQDL